LLWFDIHRSRPADQEGEPLAQERDSEARADRRDAALVAQYLHELSERHASPAEDEPGEDSAES